MILLLGYPHLLHLTLVSFFLFRFLRFCQAKPSTEQTVMALHRKTLPSISRFSSPLIVIRSIIHYWNKPCNFSIFEAMHFKFSDNTNVVWDLQHVLTSLVYLQIMVRRHVFTTFLIFLVVFANLKSHLCDNTVFCSVSLFVSYIPLILWVFVIDFWLYYVSSEN